MEEELYGKKGIDTPYERERIEYKPSVEYPEQDRYFTIPPKTELRIERARDFSITQSMFDYDTLTDQITELMQVIEARNQTGEFTIFKKNLETNQVKNALEEEDRSSHIRGTGDFEVYSVLYRMKSSVVSRRAFLDAHYRNQITSEKDIEKIAEKEDESIEQWVQLENEFLQAKSELNRLYNDDYHDDGEKSSGISDRIAYLEQFLTAKEQEKREKENLHSTLADAGYVHRNRYLFFNDIVDAIRPLVLFPQVVLKDHVKSFIQQLTQVKDLAPIKAHLILAYQSVKTQHNNAKGQMTMIDDTKEEFVSKQQWFFQQLKSKANQPLQNWFYNIEESSSTTFNLFADIVVGSIKDSQQKYDSSITDILRFYQNESSFYHEQVQLIQKKEEIRRFLRIIEDIEGLKEINENWTMEYLKANGYSVL